MAYQIELYQKDICENKHKGDENSLNSFENCKKSFQAVRDKILKYLDSRASDGATSEEISRAIGLPLHSISGRCSELKARKKISVIGKKPNRSGRPASILISNKFLGGR